MTTQDTPTTQTHRGEPLPWAIRGYIDATRKKRTPTHRKNRAQQRKAR